MRGATRAAAHDLPCCINKSAPDRSRRSPRPRDPPQRSRRLADHPGSFGAHALEIVRGDARKRLQPGMGPRPVRLSRRCLCRE